MKTCVILNPSAGSRDAGQVHAALAALEDAVVWPTRAGGEAVDLARRAVHEGEDMVVAAGGDGTIGEVVNGLAAALDRVRLGILPVGTGNDFARAVGIPLDLEQAGALLRSGAERRLDAVRICHEQQLCWLFVNVAVSGFHEDAQHRIEEQFKNNWGPLGYLRAAAEAIPAITPHHIRLEFDDGPPLELEGSSVVVANAVYMSAGIPIAPSARLDDGKLDVLLFRPANVAELALLAPLILTGTHETSDWVVHRRTRRLTVRAAPPLPFHVDDRFYTHTRLDFEVLPGALRVVAPEPAGPTEG